MRRTKRKRKNKAPSVLAAERLSGMMLRGKKNKIHDDKKRKKIEKILKKEREER